MKCTSGWLKKVNGMVRISLFSIFKSLYTTMLGTCRAPEVVPVGAQVRPYRTGAKRTPEWPGRNDWARHNVPFITATPKNFHLTNPIFNNQDEYFSPDIRPLKKQGTGSR